jgi:hypothetical protein
MTKLEEPPGKRAAKAAALSDFVHGRFSLERMVEDAIAGYRAAFERRESHAIRDNFEDPVKASVNAGG